MRGGIFLPPRGRMEEPRMKSTIAVLAETLGILFSMGFRASPSVETPSPCCQIARDALEPSRQ